jgi:hypothetical protein
MVEHKGNAVCVSIHEAARLQVKQRIAQIDLQRAVLAVAAVLAAAATNAAVDAAVAQMKDLMIGYQADSEADAAWWPFKHNSSAWRQQVMDSKDNNNKAMDNNNKVMHSN